MKVVNGSAGIWEEVGINLPTESQTQCRVLQINGNHWAETPTAGARLLGQVPQPGAGVRVGWVLSLPCGTTATGWGPKRWGKSAELEQSRGARLN